MRERKSNMQGDIVRMEALNAGQNIGATNYIDQDDFYPASGITENEDGDIDTIDMVYDHRENDLTSSADFFDGDYQNSYADGEEDYDDLDDDDYEEFDDEDDYDDFDDDDYEDFDDDDEDDYDNYDGIDPEDTEAEWGEFDGEDDIDMDESTGDYNDMPSGAFDFFDGGDPELDIDYNAFDSDTFSEVRGRRRRNAGRTAEKVMSYTPLGMAKKAMDARYSEEGQERAEERRERRRAKREDRQEERKERREGRKSAREEKREERQERRRSRKDERQELRSKKKLAKIGEVEARNEATRALSQQPAEDPATAQIMADLTKRSANTQPQKKGLSTGAIVGISLGALAVVGTAMFLILRKK